MDAWKIGLVLLPLCAGCQQMRLPTSPDTVATVAAIDVSAAHVVDDARPAEAAPFSTSGPITPATPRVTVPAWRQAILQKIIAGLTDEAVRQTRAYPGVVIRFEIEAARGGSVIEGELRDPHQPRSHDEIHLYYLLLPGALTFADKATLLSALETAVTYNAEVRLRSGEVGCCRTKPTIAVTGRFEGLFTVDHTGH